MNWAAKALRSAPVVFLIFAGGLVLVAYSIQHRLFFVIPIAAAAVHLLVTIAQGTPHSRFVPRFLRRWILGDKKG